ncbi:MAG: hypothetical protein A2508_06260 [Candidatus Lambdaproteobacteria bacterium RIFOXYD12_FULL_49_8]|uniref:Uncharacterized protein n=1 Tax=Candidatus Lambdaproteobacteria bacterium RIFOXYD2_FULL_50_16 TaxID=1817772 RepID=A0A1F6GEX6_9PROT|nr:MAG: hypothetical protein A2527_03630 [Candidatus Lambdaproteobacteria bacterium RIFOXYD2_FULL_50_16]OGG98380.1 MAG: hypothetical protein A2508_06260 [Candidatus Lambdaproteobacteria bacterium RIFOXYD12_FULL_49_8]
MKKATQAALIMAGILVFQSAHAVAFLYKDDKGFSHYRCEATGGGKLRLRQVTKEKFLVYGGLISGALVLAKTPEEAGRKACKEQD